MWEGNERYKRILSVGRFCPELASFPERPPANGCHIEEDAAAEENDKIQTAFIAFTRILSGKIRKGTLCYALGPKHDPALALAAVSLRVQL